MATLLEHTRDYLITQNVGRRPSIAGARPPLWLEPRHGVPAPGEGQNATETDNDVVVGLFISGGVTLPRHNGFMRTDGIDFWIRARTPPLAVSFEKDLRASLNDKRGWDMAGLYVAESLIFRDIQRIGSDDQGWAFVTEYLITTFTQ